VKRPRAHPALRLSLGLTCIALALVIAAEGALGFLQSSSEKERGIRSTLAETLAVQVAVLLASGDAQALQHTLGAVLDRNPRLESVGVRRGDGELVAHAGPHAVRWQPQSSTLSTLKHVRVPLQLPRGSWGEVELAFVPIADAGMLGWRERRTPAAIVLLAPAVLLLFYLYLRRSLQQLHPSRAVPDRVRQAFDTLPDGIVVLDDRGRIVIANRAFTRLHPAATAELTGMRLSQLEWLIPALPAAEAHHPWVRCLAADARDRAQPPELLIEIAQPAGAPVHAVLSCAAIFDDAGVMRGCLVSFDDVSDLQQANQRLKATLTQLEVSRRRVEQQNRQLHRLATRDALTDCLNRRAFLDDAVALFSHAVAGARPLACIMLDIDRFKSINDSYGHAFGDDVIKSVATQLGLGLREGDLLCRYGGEEFCVMLPEVGAELATRIAERLREAVEKRTGIGLKAIEVPAVTCSFGVATLAASDRSVEGLIDRADRLLYVAKSTGRNRVCAGDPTAGAALQAS
jgi:diguanylate cyclase (GGDEF)-like protein/PAS domain S-box-containing protein